MSQLTDTLYAEHRRIEAKLEELDRIVAAAPETVPVAFFLETLEFFVTFADGVHHHREEAVLFPALVQAGVPVEHGPIAVMLHEHDLGRGCLRDVRRCLQTSPIDVAELYRHAAEYSALLRAHIWKEDNVLFPLADRLLPDAQAA